MPSHAFLGAGASYSCHLAEDAYSAVARAGARWNCVAHNLSSDSAQSGIPADKGWNSTPSRLACAPCVGGTSEGSNAPVFIATPHRRWSALLRTKLPSSASLVGSKRWCDVKLERPLIQPSVLRSLRRLRDPSCFWTRFRVQRGLSANRKLPVMFKRKNGEMRTGANAVGFSASWRQSA